MTDSIAIFFMAAGLAGVAAPLALHFAHRLGLLDRPGGRKQHCTPTPQIGGLVIYAALWALCFSDAADSLAPAVLALSTITVLVGYLDDRSELSARLRLLSHALIGALLALWAGVSLQSVGALFGDTAVQLGIFALPATMFAVAAAKNAYNMVDGIDGLAGGLAFIPVVFVAALAGAAGQTALLHLCLVTAAGLAVFLLMNYPLPGRARAITFMGDTGSTLLGLLVAWVALQGAQLGLYRPVFALFLVAAPLLDTAGVMMRRRMRGEPLFQAGRDHLHHILVDGGFPRAFTTYLLTSVSVVIALAGWAMERAAWTETTMLLIFLAMLAANLLVLRNEARAKAFLNNRLTSPR